MSSVRLRRLTADFQRLSEYARRHPRLRLIQSDGDPPERYQIEYRIRSLRQVDDDLQPIKSHIVEINLPRNYPRTPPQCRMLSPVFHPNIAPHAICVGDHWSAGESLQSIVSRIGEMLAYQSYNVKSPLNGEAARWVDEHEDDLPLDPVSMLVEENDEDEEVEWDEIAPSASDVPPPAIPSSSTRKLATAKRQTRSAPIAERSPGVPAQPAPVKVTPPVQELRPEVARESQPKVTVACPSCDHKYRVPSSAAGRNAKCQQCQTVFPIPG